MPILGTFLAGPYNVALTAAVMVGLFLAVRAGRSAGLSPLAWRVLLVTAATGGLIGSTFIFLDFHAPRLGEKSNLGGLIAGIAVVVLLARWFRIGALRALDLMAVPTLVGMAIGRVGCFLAGCCAGTHTGLPWGVHVDGDAEAIHPVQLYETFADLLLVGALARWVPLQKPGQRIGFAVASYAGIRFATEFVRAGRTSVFGLNPVQWSVLTIGLAVATWLWHRRSAQPVSANGAMPHDEQRAFFTALVVTGALLIVAVRFSDAFVPFERVFMLTAACAIGGYAVLRHSPRWLARPLVPSLGALFLFNTPADSVPRKREILVGGGFWGGAYSAVVGENPYSYTDCNGGEISGSDPTLAKRRSTTGWFSGGLRQRTNSGKRITVEGQLLAGSDKLQSLGGGVVDEPVANTASILAGGAAFTVEGMNQHLRINVLGGQLSERGTEAQGITGSVTARTGVKDGFYVEGNVAPAKWYASTGDFSYAGLGYVISDAGARALIGLGGGAYLGVHVPVGSFELDVIGRAPASTSKIKDPGATLSVGVKKAFTIR